MPDNYTISKEFDIETEHRWFLSGASVIHKLFVISPFDASQP
jgi:hypothetical protein